MLAPLRTLGLLLLWLAMPLALASCGAGLIGGAVASGGDGGSTPATPQLSLPTQSFPLSPIPVATQRTVVIANASLSPSASLNVQLRVPGPSLPDGRPTFVASADQASPVLLSGQGASTVVGFQLRTAPITQVVGSTVDVAAQIAVLADGREVAAPLAVTLLAQPSVRLFDGVPLYMSPNGGQIVRLACKNLRSTDASGLAVSVVTADASLTGAFVTRPCLRPTFQSPSITDLSLLQAGERLVTAEAPSNTFAGSAAFFVDDAIAGRSAQVADAYYQPDVQLALPAQGSTRGGTKVTLIGRALLALTTTGAPGAPDLDGVQIQLRKGDRIVDLDQGAIVRAESALDRIAFFMPPSPDGRPGDVGIALRVRVPGPSGDPLSIEVVARGVFLYGNPEPVFGPRGALLDRDPVAVTPIALEGAPSNAQATDFAALYSTGGAASVQLLLAQENGLFIRFGAARRIGDPENASERGPRDLLSGDFDRDGVPDLLIINEGSATATMLLVRGQAAPLPPLGAVQRLPAPPGMAMGRVADFDGDGGPDVLLMPGSNAALGTLPVVLRSRVVGGAATFLPPIPLPVRSRNYDAIEAADLDGDGALDVGVLTGRDQQQLDIAYGDGLGGFVAGPALDLVVPRVGYVADAASKAVGLHAVGAAPCALTVVLAGMPPLPFSTPPGPAENPDTPPMIFVVRPSGPRTYGQPQPQDVLQLVGAIDPFRASTAVNLDGDGAGADELLVGSTGELGQFSLGLFRYEPTNGLRVVRVVTDFRPTQVAAFFVGVAFPADPQLGQPAQAGLFVQHELTVDGQQERRLSTLLVTRDATDILLLPPDVVFPVPLAGVVGGRFSTVGVASDGEVRDIAVPSAAQIQLGDNDGFGALAPGRKMAHAGLVPESVVRVPEPLGNADLLAFLDDGLRDGRSDGVLRIGAWRPELNGSQQQQPQQFTEDLRALMPARFASASIDPRSRLEARDIDGDGDQDLAALLRFVGLSGDGDALLVLLRRASSSPGEFLFEPLRPSDFEPVPGVSASFALGDFARDGQTQPIRLELALAVPTDTSPGAGDGNHVRFYRARAAAGSSLRWSRSQDVAGPRALSTGNAPTRIAASDFDGNGSEDLMVACDGDATLHVHLNAGEPASLSGEVNIGAFVESFGSPLSLPSGRNTYLLLGDINGDGDVDALVATESTTALGELSTQVAFHLRVGAGEFANGIRVSPTRLSNRDARLSIDLGDINRDGAPDLTLGWFQSGAQVDNLLVLLGGSL